MMKIQSLTLRFNNNEEDELAATLKFISEQPTPVHYSGQMQQQSSMRSPQYQKLMEAQQRMC